MSGEYEALGGKEAEEAEEKKRQIPSVEEINSGCTYYSLFIELSETDLDAIGAAEFTI